MNPRINVPPIAFIDSGIGGLPYLSHLRGLMPEAPLVYVADNLNFPYGPKSEDEVKNSVRAMTQRLIERYQPRLIIVACNTASMVALDQLRADFSQEFVGVVPAVKPAAAVSRSRALGIMATERSLKGAYLDNLIAQHAPDCKVVRCAASELIHNIETDPFIEKPVHYMELLQEIRSHFVKNAVDTIVLGCTHFLHLSPELLSVFGEDFTIVDSREGVSRQALRVLERQGILSEYQNIDGGFDSVFHLTTTESTPVRGATMLTYERVAARFNLKFKGNL